MVMRNLSACLLWISILVLAMDSRAELYKCQEADGLVSFLNKPCPKGSKTIPLGGDIDANVHSFSSNRKFDLEVIGSRLPAGFVGQSMNQLVPALEKLAQITKREFETTAQFENRLNEAISKPLFGDLRASDQVVFTIQAQRGYATVSYTYDADTQKTSVTLNLHPVLLEGVDREPVNGSAPAIKGIKLATDTTWTGSYRATNTMGARITVNIGKQKTLTFAAEQLPFELNQSFELSPQKAQALLPRMRALFEVRFSPPYVTSNSWQTKPTFNSPIEVSIKDTFLRGEVTRIWFYSPETGEIFLKAPRRE
jgi:hypothetical protein